MSNIYNIGRGAPSRDKSQEIVVPEIAVMNDLLDEVKRRSVTFDNPIQRVFEATQRAISNIKVMKDTLDYEPFYIRKKDGELILDKAGGNKLLLPYDDYFKECKIDAGQFDRIMLDPNHEHIVNFPAVFIRFVDIRYLVQQQRIGEGRATMRIRFIINNINNTDPIIETMPFRLFQLINASIQDAKAYEEAYRDRVNLTYNDMPERARGLQAYWIDYEVYFKDWSGWVFNNYVEKYLVAPPFVNFSDYPDRFPKDEFPDVKIDFGTVSKIKKE